jgi:hypothetical protein
VCALSVTCFASAVVFAGVARERGVGRASEVRLCWEYVRKERERKRGDLGLESQFGKPGAYLRNTVCGKVLTGSGSRGYYDGYGW